MTVNFLTPIEHHPGERRALADDQRILTYDEMRALAMRAARWLHEKYGSGGFVVIRATSAVDFVVTLLGTIYSGNTPVPVEPQMPERALEYILDKCHAPSALQPLQEDQYGNLEPLSHTDPGRPAMVMFTSGTTGKPKGVIMTHVNLVQSCTVVADYLGYRQSPSTLVVLPLYYSYGLISQVLCQLYIGGYVRLMAGLRNPVAFTQAIKDEQIETFCGVPSTFLTLTKFTRLKPFQLSSVKVICTAGAAFDLSLYENIKQVFPNATVFNNYGMTEACPRLAYISDSDERFLHGTCGKPMAGVEAVIIDPVNGAHLSEGESGVLAVRGTNITPGYLYDEERTRKAFTKDGFLLTGDVAYLDNGYIFLHGRIDDIFNVAGEKVSPLEIEAVLNSMPEVECAAVRGMQDAARGSAPVAFLILREPVSKQHLDTALATQLSPNKIPVAYYQVSEVPMTSNGKIQRRLLAVDSASILKNIE